VAALEMGVLCVTEDRELQEKFPGIAISIKEFLSHESTRVVRKPKPKYRKNW
jgi:hypothetical protein